MASEFIASTSNLQSAPLIGGGIGEKKVNELMKSA